MFLGALTNIITFPGLIVKSMINNSIAKALGLEKVSVKKVVKEPEKEEKGEETVEEYRYTMRALIITIFIRFILLTSIGIGFYWLLSIVYTGDFKYLLDNISFFQGILLWLGISFTIHALPSSSEGVTSWKIATANKGFKSFVQVCISLLFWAFAILNYFWIDLFYAVWIARLVGEFLG